MTGNANNVTLNAYVNCVCRQLLRCNVTTCVKLRYVRFANVLNPVKNTGDCGENIVFYKSNGRRMKGIVKILLITARTFSTFVNCNKNAHRNFLKLYYVENTVLLSLGLALKIRVSLVRFQSRPPDTPHSFARGCGVFLWVHLLLMLIRMLNPLSTR